MSQIGYGAEYVYSELQRVSHRVDGVRDEIEGQVVVAIRLVVEEGTPSVIFCLGLEEAARLRDDLNRVLED